MKIVMVNHFTQVPGETGNGRFAYLIDLFLKEGHEVELITTSFSHRTKKQRIMDDEKIKKLPYKLTMLYEPGYIKNVSLKRFYSHFVYGRSLKNYLKSIEKPDIIYCSVPSLSCGKEAAKYANKNEVKFIVDVQDLWPEAFKMVFNIPMISDIIFWPMKKMANYIYSQADEIIAVSETYVNRAKSVNSKVEKGHSIYLGTVLSKFDSIIKEEKELEKIKLVYIGTLGHSYDLCLFFDALKILQSKYNNIELLVMGDGPLLNKFQNRANELGINVKFTGPLNYDVMVSKLCACDIALNPIARGAAQSIINKVGDYAAAGLPVISTQECEEYRILLDKYHCGFTCVYDANEIADTIKKLILDKSLMIELSTNSRKLAEEKFDREKTYIEIINLI